MFILSVVCKNILPKIAIKIKFYFSLIFRHINFEFLYTTFFKKNMKEKIIDLFLNFLEQDIYIVGSVLLAIPLVIFVIAILYFVFTFRKSTRFMKVAKIIFTLIMIPEIYFLCYWIYIFYCLETGKMMDLPL